MRLLNIVCFGALIISSGWVFSQDGSAPILPSESEVVSPAMTAPLTEQPAGQPPVPPVIIKRFEGQLDDVKDLTPIEQDAPYNVLLKYITRLYPDEISAKVLTEVTYEDLMKTPEKYRGELIRCKGVLLFLNPYQLRTNPAGVDIYYSGMLGNPSTDELYFFHLIDKPAEPLRNMAENRSMADEVVVEGAFLKIMLYELDARAKSRTGQTHNSAPFIIGRTIFKVPQPAPAAAQKFQWLIALVLGVVLTSIVAYIILAGRREKKETMSLFGKHKSAPPPDKKNPV
jgi:hypothetical protein